MRRNRFIIMLILLLMFLQVQFEGFSVASAKMRSGEPVTLTQSNQILESISYNGIVIEAAYTNGAYSGSDPTYSCAAFVKKFYSMVYGIGVYNLISKDSIPLVYNNQGTFSQTNQPQIGDIIRDNTRTHWAIVRSISGDIINVVQQNYRSGNMAWINCTIERNDTGYSYFTYSNRVEDTAGAINNIEVPDSSGLNTGAVDTPVLPVNANPVMLPDGTYRLLQASNLNYINALEEADGWKVNTDVYHDANSQKISVVRVGEKEYALQFLSNKRFLSVSKTDQLVTSEELKQYFVLIQRENGYYTLSPTQNQDKVVAYIQAASQNGQPSLIMKDYSGSLEECWCLEMLSLEVLPIIPKATSSKKTLYMGYQDDTIGLTQLKKDAVVTYSSDDTVIAEVNSTGVVTPKSVGEANITIEVYQNSTIYQLQVSIVVKKPYVKVEASNKTVSVGDSISLQIKKYGTKSTVTWQISDQTRAVIDSKSGSLLAKKRGTVTVTAKTADGLIAKIKLKII